MARIPPYTPISLPTSIGPASIGGAVAKASEIDWQGLIPAADIQGRSDALAWLSEHLGAFLREVSGLSLTGGVLELTYRDRSGSRSASIDLSSLGGAVGGEDGHTDGWEASRRPVADYGATAPAVWVRSDSSGALEIGDSGGRVNGAAELAPTGTSAPWSAGAGNSTATFWARRGQSEHVHYRSRDGAHSGEHVHETDGPHEIVGLAASDDRVWALLHETQHDYVRLVTYAVDQTGAQDPAPVATLDQHSIQGDLPAGLDYATEVRGLALAPNRLRVLIEGTDASGAAVTQALAFGRDEPQGVLPWPRFAADDRHLGVHGDVRDGWFEASDEWLLQDHWVTRWNDTSILGHADTPETFAGSANRVLLASAAEDRMEFGPLSRAREPFQPIAADVALPDDGLTAVPGLTAGSWDWIALLVKDIYGRRHGPWMIPHADLDALAASAATSLAGAPDTENRSHTMIFGVSHTITVGAVKRADGSLAFGSREDEPESLRLRLVGDWTLRVQGGMIADVPHSQFVRTGITMPNPPGTRIDAQFAISVGRDGTNPLHGRMIYIDANQFDALERLDHSDPPAIDESATAANSLHLRGVMGNADRDLWLAMTPSRRLYMRTSISGHRAWPFRVWRTWGSGLTDLGVAADIYGAGKRS